MHKIQSIKSSIFLLPFALLLFTPACIGPKGLTATRYRYNEAIQRTDAEELLLNLVRLRYVDSTVDLPVSAVNSQFALEGSTDLRGIYGPSSSRIGSANLNIAERPTVTFNPTASDETASAFLTPFELEELAFLATSYDIGSVFRLFASSVNGLDNASTADGPQRATPPNFVEFREFARLLTELQQMEAIKFGVDSSASEVGVAVPASQFDAETQLKILKEGYTIKKPDDQGQVDELVIAKRSQGRIVKFVENQFSFQQIADIKMSLRIEPLKDQFELKRAAEGFLPKGEEPYSKINISTRSLLQVQFFVSQGIQLPQEHIQCGLAPAAFNPDGSLFDWSQVLGGLFRVNCSKQKPKCSRVAVKYRGYWFYVNDNDRDSINTLHLLRYATRLARLRTSAKTPKTPVLTLPIGR